MFVDAGMAKAIFANLVGPELPDLIAGLVSLLAIIGFVQYWKPPYRAEYEATIRVNTSSDEEKTNVSVTHVPETDQTKSDASKESHSAEEDDDHEPHTALALTKPSWLETAIAWSPWIIIVVVVIA